MDDTKLLASVTAAIHTGVCHRQPGNLPQVHPVQLRTFLGRSEPSITPLPVPPPRQPVRTRQLLKDDTEVIEILSSEDELEAEASLCPTSASSDPPEPPSPLLLPSSDPPDPLERSDDEVEGSGVILLSPTSWYDPNIISRAILGPAEINRQNKLQRVEYLKNIPPYFPVFREPMAIVIDMRDPKFDFYDKEGVLLAPDTIILDQNQESWATSSGGGDHHPTCLIFNGTKVKCRRSRHTCNGCYRCSELDPSLVNVIHFELDTSTRTNLKDVSAADVARRARSGSTASQAHADTPVESGWLHK
ncbi:hypothetical protein DFH08DRAFT_974707 [Mycena albidolilacea]|uniref:Uncharacterized protein n=1 Tax=Mycena albidolilacea TaxID=1033008 RepID=A0AAD7EC59_9AGAR|nr:hypothetical protein DFH08DRAFT_974707 [Mycena albidolilacea]